MKPLDTTIGKTIQAVEVNERDPSVTFTFTDGTQLSLMNTSKPTLDVAFFTGDADDQGMQETIGGGK